eukprot:1647104-Amphidinium_carterae.1
MEPFGAEEKTEMLSRQALRRKQSRTPWAMGGGRSSMYGGGPEVVRTALDIYSPAPRLPPPLPPHLPRQRFNTRARDTDDASLGK